MATLPWYLTEANLEDIPALMGRSSKQRDSYKTALLYMNRFLLNEDKYLRIRDLMNEHVEGDSLKDLLEDYCGWFACEQIWTKQKTWLSTDSKVISIGLAKEILCHK